MEELSPTCEYSCCFSNFGNHIVYQISNHDIMIPRSVKSETSVRFIKQYKLFLWSGFVLGFFFFLYLNYYWDTVFVHLPYIHPLVTKTEAVQVICMYVTPI